MIKSYLGEGVYVSFDGSITLTSESRDGKTDTIRLVPAVYRAFLVWLRDMGAAR